MAILPVIIAPDPILDKVSEPVQEVNKDIQKIVDDMMETLRHYKGAGLAAPQVAIHKRILLLDISSYYGKEMPTYIIINPELTYKSEETWTATEGCISIPVGSRIPVTRPKSIKLKYLDYYGKENEIEADDWLARGFQHEIDHLDGITGLNYLSKLKRDLMIRKLIKYKKQIHHDKLAKHDL